MNDGVMSPARKTKMGSIPKYLIDRKLEWAQKEKERLEELEAEKIPEGMMLIPEDERLETLHGLLKSNLLTKVRS
jgi:hypothetical protein